MRARQADRPAGGPAATPDEALEALARETRFPPKLLRDLDHLLSRRGQVALEGTTGVGKTYLARRFAAVFAGSPQRVRVVQLHPAYRYEDFMEAPAPRGEAATGPAGGAAHAAVPGIFKTFAARAARDPNNRYVVVLDELGHADALAILGEAYSLLEYRDEEVLLPYSREPFSLPKNLYILATASTGPSSRTLQDAAIRRRFHFLRLDPSAEILRSWLTETRPQYVWVADVFAEMNRRLVKEVGPRAQLGQSLFMQPGLDDAELERIFRTDVRPLLETVIEDEKGLAKFELAALKKAAGATEGGRG
jgi:5-methylcytosine-specific restriction protein B